MLEVKCFQEEFLNFWHGQLSGLKNILSKLVNVCKQQRSRWVCLMVFNATFKNISVISWQSVLLVEETGVAGENHDLSQVTYKLYHLTMGLNSQLWWLKALIAQVVENPTTIRSQP
jgi:hypothetical protein